MHQTSQQFIPSDIQSTSIIAFAVFAMDGTNNNVAAAADDMSGMKCIDVRGHPAMTLAQLKLHIANVIGRSDPFFQLISIAQGFLPPDQTLSALGLTNGSQLSIMDDDDAPVLADADMDALNKTVAFKWPNTDDDQSINIAVIVMPNTTIDEARFPSNDITIPLTAAVLANNTDLSHRSFRANLAVDINDDNDSEYISVHTDVNSLPSSAADDEAYYNDFGQYNGGLLDGFRILNATSMESPEDVIRLVLPDCQPALIAVEIEHLSHFINLTYLDLTGNYLNINQFTKLTSLQELSLACNNIKDISFLPLPFTTSELLLANASQNIIEENTNTENGQREPQMTFITSNEQEDSTGVTAVHTGEKTTNTEFVSSTLSSPDSHAKVSPLSTGDENAAANDQELDSRSQSGSSNADVLLMSPTVSRTDFGHLRGLDLSHNNIPYQQIVHLCSLPNLISLSLANNNLYRLPKILLFNKLQKFILSGNYLGNWKKRRDHSSKLRISILLQRAITKLLLLSSSSSVQQQQQRLLVRYSHDNDIDTQWFAKQNKLHNEKDDNVWQALSSIPSLTEIDLSHNLLQYIPVYINNNNNLNYFPNLKNLNLSDNFISTSHIHLYGLKKFIHLQQIDLSQNLFNYGKRIITNNNININNNYKKDFPFIQERLCNEHNMIIAITSKMTRSDATSLHPYIHDDRRHLMIPATTTAMIQAQQQDIPIVVRPFSNKQEKRTKSATSATINELTVLRCSDDELNELLYDSPQPSATVLHSVSVLQRTVETLRLSDVTTNRYASANVSLPQKQYYSRAKPYAEMKMQTSKQNDIYDHIIAAIDNMKSADTAEEKTETPPQLPFGARSVVPQSARTGPTKKSLVADGRRRRLFDRERRAAENDALMKLVAASAAP